MFTAVAARVPEPVVLRATVWFWAMAVGKGQVITVKAGPL